MATAPGWMRVPSPRWPPAAAAGINPGVFSLVSPPRPGAHGFLVFEDPAAGAGRQQLVDGPALGGLLASREWRCWC